MHSGLCTSRSNMYALWAIGNMLEPALGGALGIIYLGGLIGGSLARARARSRTDSPLALGSDLALFAANVHRTTRGRHRSLAFRHRRSHRQHLYHARNPFISKGGHIGGLLGGAPVVVLIERPAHGQSAGTLIAAAGAVR